MQKDFKTFLSQLKETNATLGFYCDFAKISRNVANIAISLNMLNFLIGKRDLRTAVELLWERDPSVFNVMDILIATRKKDNKKYLDESGNCLPIHSLFSSIDGVLKFISETGLDTLFQKPEVNNLVDYVFGVETGLDSNARKNRSGTITEKIVANIFRSHGVEFREQVHSSLFPQITSALGADTKVFDFVIESKGKTYLIETIFYSGGGSKLNEVARSYMDIAPKINVVTGFEFVWITDGIGWHNASNKLEEAFYTIPRIYNLTTITDFIEDVK